MTSTRLRVGGLVRHKHTKATATIVRLTRKTTAGLFGPITEVSQVGLLFGSSTKVWTCSVEAFHRNYLCL